MRVAAGIAGIASALFLSFASPALSVNPDEMLQDPVLEERARALSKVLRCVVCRNQSIDDSNAGVARDMRLVIRERLAAGDTDQQVLDYIVARYGTFSLLKPPVNRTTIALWVAPGVLLILFCVGFGLRWRQRRGQVELDQEAHSSEDQELLDRLMSRDPSR